MSEIPNNRDSQEKLLAYLKETVNELEDATEFMEGFIGYEDEEAIERRKSKENLIRNVYEFIDEYENHIYRSTTLPVETLQHNHNQFVSELNDTKQTLFQSLIREKLLRSGMDYESEEFVNAVGNGMNSRISHLDELLDEHEVEMILEIGDHTEIQLVTPEFASENIDTREPQGLFYVEYEDHYVAIDNSNGEAFTEEFKSLNECLMYLKGEELARVYVGDKEVYLIEDHDLDVEVDYEDYYKSAEHTANEVYNFIEENDLSPLSKSRGIVLVPLESDGFIVTSEGELFTIVDDFVADASNKQQIKKNNEIEL